MVWCFCCSNGWKVHSFHYYCLEDRGWYYCTYRPLEHPRPSAAWSTYRKVLEETYLGWSETQQYWQDVRTMETNEAEATALQ